MWLISHLKQLTRPSPKSKDKEVGSTCYEATYKCCVEPELGGRYEWAELGSPKISMLKPYPMI